LPTLSLSRPPLITPRFAVTLLHIDFAFLSLTPARRRHDDDTLRLSRRFYFRCLEPGVCDMMLMFALPRCCHARAAAAARCAFALPFRHFAAAQMRAALFVDVAARYPLECCFRRRRLRYYLCLSLPLMPLRCHC